MKPRPMGVVRCKCGLSSTLIMAPRAWMRSMMCTPFETKTGLAATKESRRHHLDGGTPVDPLCPPAIPEDHLQTKLSDLSLSPPAYLASCG